MPVRYHLIAALALATIAAADSHVVYTIERDGQPVAGAVYASGVDAGRAAERLAIANPGSAIAVAAFGRWEVGKVAPGPVDVRVSDKQSGENLVNPVPAIGATMPVGIVSFELLKGYHTFDRMEWWQGGKLRQTERSAPYTWHVDLSTQPPGPFTTTVKTFDAAGKAINQFDVQIMLAPRQAPAKPAKAALRWQPPTERENGKPLPAADLAGYAVIHTTDGTQRRIALGGPATSTTMELGQGRHALSVVAIDSSGLESEPSNTVEVTVP